MVILLNMLINSPKDVTATILKESLMKCGLASFLISSFNGALNRSPHVFLSACIQFIVSYDKIKAKVENYFSIYVSEIKERKNGIPETRGQLNNRKSIHDRPIVVEQRTRFGDLEIDTIVGNHHQQSLVSIVDRKTGYL